MFIHLSQPQLQNNLCPYPDMLCIFFSTIIPQTTTFPLKFNDSILVLSGRSEPRWRRPRFLLDNPPSWQTLRSCRRPFAPPSRQAKSSVAKAATSILLKCTKKRSSISSVESTPNARKRFTAFSRPPSRVTVSSRKKTASPNTRTPNAFGTSIPWMGRRTSCTVSRSTP